MDSYDDTELALMKFGVGQPVPRMEDPTLLRGRGRYTDDINLAGQAYAVMVRSRIAHGILKGIDTTAARAMPGVLAVYTHADLDAAGFGPLKCPMNIPQRDGSPMKTPPRPSLAKGKVRFVGEAVACVVAETAVQAKDAAEAVELDIEELPAVTSPAEGLKPGAPQIHDDVPGNLALDFHYGDGEAVKKAFAEAAHVTRLEIVSNRIVVNPMEPRSAIGSYDPKTERWTLNVGCQGVMGMRGGLARDVLNVPTDKVRVLTGNVGGSFGMKSQVYPEYGPLLLGRQAARPAGEMDRRALGKLFERPSRPRSPAHRRAGARQGRPLPRRAAHRHRQCRRLHLSADAGHDQRGEEHHRRLRHARDGGELQGGVHQHHADRRLSRRRPPRGQLLHGAPDRHGGARDGHRQGRAAPAQPHRARTDALQGAVGHELRFRRVHHRARQGIAGGRLAGLRQAQGREPARRTSCAVAASARTSKSPARRPRNMAACASRPTAPSPC